MVRSHPPLCWPSWRVVSLSVAAPASAYASAVVVPAARVAEQRERMAAAASVLPDPAAAARRATRRRRPSRPARCLRPRQLRDVLHHRGQYGQCQDGEGDPGQASAADVLGRPYPRRRSRQQVPVPPEPRRPVLPAHLHHRTEPGQFAELPAGCAAQPGRSRDPHGREALYNYDEATKKATPFTADMGTCVMRLTQRQHQVVSATRPEHPDPRHHVTTQPSTRIRTNEDVAYQDAATAPGGTATRTPTIKPVAYDVGGDGPLQDPARRPRRPV